MRVSAVALPPARGGVAAVRLAVGAEGLALCLGEEHVGPHAVLGPGADRVGEVQARVWFVQAPGSPAVVLGGFDVVPLVVNRIGDDWAVAIRRHRRPGGDFVHDESSCLVLYGIFRRDVSHVRYSYLP